jgi:hypothetical protein
VFFNSVSGTGHTKSVLILETRVLTEYTVYIYLSGMYLKLPLHICFGAEILYFAGIFIGSAAYLRFADWQKKKIQAVQSVAPYASWHPSPRQFKKSCMITSGYLERFEEKTSRHDEACGFQVLRKPALFPVYPDKSWAGSIFVQSTGLLQTTDSLVTTAGRLPSPTNPQNEMFRRDYSPVSL